MKYRIQKILSYLLVVLTFFCMLVFALTWRTEQQAVTFVPPWEADLSQIAAKEELSAGDYDLLWQQTGLSKSDIDLIWVKETDIAGTLYRYQQRFLAKSAFDSEVLSGFSKTERIADRNQYYQLYDLQEGDVLLTKSTHTLCYRHGHSGLYLGGGEEHLLEATVIGAPASLTTAAAWGGYPTGMQLRVSEAAAAKAGMSVTELGAAVAAYAQEDLRGDDYHLLSGLFGIGVDTDATQCAYLIYEAYAHFGVEVSSRTFPVTPSSLLQSGAFDLIQVWGVDPLDPDW